MPFKQSVNGDYLSGDLRQRRLNAEGGCSTCDVISVISWSLLSFPLEK